MTGGFLGRTIHSKALGSPIAILIPRCSPRGHELQLGGGGHRASKGGPVKSLLNIIWSDEGQDIAEYAVMLAVILVLVVGTIRLVGSNANNAFSAVASSIQ